MTELFKIYQLTAAEVSKISEEPNEPHIHDYEELLVGLDGELEHFIDFNATILKSPFTSFIAKGKLHRVKPLLCNGNCGIWVIRFKTEFLSDTYFRLYSHYYAHSDLEIKDKNAFSRMVAICEMMFAEMQLPSPKFSVVRDLLRALFSMIEAERERQEVNQDALLNAQNSTFKKFLEVLEENFRKPVGVEFYADKLNMSIRNLNSICQNMINQSVSEIIEARRMTEGKNLLVSTDKTVAEIGFDLGYNEKSCFTTVFKKSSGQTPTTFRKEMRKILS